MIEIHPGLYVGSEADERAIRGQSGWFVVHACKEPYHRQTLGYTGRAAAKDHSEYQIARRPGRLILNLVDVADVNYVATEVIDAALSAIHDNIGESRGLVHCNHGASRSPSLALLYLAKHTSRFRGLAWSDAQEAFKAIYPPYAPARGMADYTRLNWARYA